MTDREFAARKNFCEKICPYGLKNYCDGSANKSQSKYIHKKPPCPHFVDGACGLQQKGE